jgi:retron-type reverse transcriptase
MSKLLDQLGASQLLSQKELMKLIRSSPRRYKVYQIPKRKPNEFRTIAQPAKEVKALQYWVIENLLSQLPVHPAAIGYRQGLNISDNARPHALGRYLLKLDFKDFFPSLTARDFRVFLRRHTLPLEPGDMEAVERILFWKPKGENILCLSIGAPSSPLLSNLLLSDFDTQTAKICASADVTYTRYADDLSFSAENSASLAKIEEAVANLCARMRSPKLTINTEKTVRVSRREARRVTGLVLTNDGKVSLGRDQKRRIRATVHHFVNGALDDQKVKALAGMLAYAKSVEPRFLVRLRRKFGAETIRRIKAGQ